MFTGIIEEIGTVRSAKRGDSGSTVTIVGEVIFDGLKLGDSVAVDGVCLTACEISGASFSADVMHETLARSTIGSLKPGCRVNLERALLACGRLSGHIVTGHIDGTGTIAEIRQDGKASIYKIKAPSKIMKYIVEKGSVAVDGISLTVASAQGGMFGVSIIPHTAKTTALAGKAVGDKVNLECDIVGKYVERLLSFDQAGEPSGGVTMDLLTKYGYAGG